MVTGRSALLAVLAAITRGACGGASAQSTRAPGSQPAILSVKQVEAETHGHPTVLLFTAQGCASCEADARALQDAAGGRSEVRLVGVDIDGSDSAPSLAAYVQAIGLRSSSFVWTIDGDNALVRRYGITSLSSTVFLDSSGQAKFINQGPQNAATYSDQLRGLQ